ncbi:hypothetical protein [Streptomyces ficellus]|uniref:Polysaccharide deacetylase n=1 Tax=Streptomyces ficellus TaxID=1977088 RepID=A0A6I6FF46_9ACTN|nr:hypothetical protein [Streptomyces ficellus]QGV82270.1 hypothetical protein EIZ62_31450 [Streptomyces ficellus]
MIRNNPAVRRLRERATTRGVALGAAAVLLATGASLVPLLTDGGDDTGPTASADRTSAPAPRPAAGQKNGGGDKDAEDEEWDGRVKVLGDGSTSYTGPQPGQLKAEKLKPGQRPPQFVVFSWDGALEGDDRLFSRFRQVAKDSNAHMTFFLTGIYLLPKDKQNLYRPPQHGQGAAAIAYPTREHIRTTLDQLGKAWKEGHEIGSHFNGHFCGAKGGGDWSEAEWTSEIDQFYSFVQNWKTNTGFTDLDPLPFDPTREVVGGRAPCLEGQKTLIPASKPFGWRYDASSSGDFQIWPSKKNGVWDLPLQMLPFPGKDFQVLSMDFNYLYNQSKGLTDGDPAMYDTWREQTRDSYLAGFERVYHGSRAPMFVGNHFEQWNGGIYMDAVEDVMKNVCRRKEVRCVSFRELTDWLDAQDPKVLAQWRTLDPAQPAGWSALKE